VGGVQPSSLKKDKAQALNPWFVTGFSDAESHFGVLVTKSKTIKLGWQVTPKFAIKLHKKDLNIIQEIFNFFGVGKVYTTPEYAIYVVTKLEDLTKVIIPHFKTYPLITKKFADFTLFCEIVKLCNAKISSLDSIQTILNIKAAMNKGGISDMLLESFPNTVAISRPDVKPQAIPNSFWVTGFVDGEGNFSIKITKNNQYKTGSSVRVWFQVNQHYRDNELINSFVNFFGCGLTYVDSKATYFVVSKLSDILNIIIPFFDEYSLRSSKLDNFLDFKQGAIMLSNKEHLSIEGLNKLVALKAGMNRGRV